MPTRSVGREPSFTKTPSGIVRPRVFKGGLGQFAAEREHLHHRAISQRGGVVVVLKPMYVLPHMTPEQISVSEYAKACAALDQSPAGRKARELLFSYLSPSQLQTARRHNYFDVGVLHPGLVRWSMEDGGPLKLSTVRFRITRGFPNGNIEMTRTNGARYNLCLHPVQPYPTDDVCLAQMMSILYDPEGFIEAANIVPVGDSPPLAKNIRMFSRRQRRSRDDLILPFMKEYPISSNIILGQN